MTPPGDGDVVMMIMMMMMMMMMMMIVMINTPIQPPACLPCRLPLLWPASPGTQTLDSRRQRQIHCCSCNTSNKITKRNYCCAHKRSTLSTDQELRDCMMAEPPIPASTTTW
jgi:hypothetical protein